MRQNLALVVGLQGRFAEAETIAKGDLPSDEAAANVAYLREMLSRKDPRGGKTVAGGRAQPARLTHDTCPTDAVPGQPDAVNPIFRADHSADAVPIRDSVKCAQPR